jgi:hypothetical protein
MVSLLISFTFLLLTRRGRIGRFTELKVFIRVLGRVSTII